METFDESTEFESMAVASPKSYLKNLQEGVFYRKLDCNSMLVSVAPGQSVYFTGKCYVQVVKGVVEIYGCQLSSQEPKRPVFSPKGHSSLSITSLAAESEMDSDISVTQQLPVFISQDELNEDSALIIMELFENEWCEGIRNYSTEGESLVGPAATGMGPGKIPRPNEFINKLGFRFIAPSVYDNHRLFSSSPVWDEVLYNLQLSDETPKLAIFGGKGVGKSTFFRWTINKCLSLFGQSVLCIDLDPGQAEFTPPGLMSVFLCQEPLLGPNFTHLVQPLKSIFIGSVNVSDCPTTYRNGINALYRFAKENKEYATIPWIINTMGFSEGLGVDLAVSVIKTFHPTSVIQITIENSRRSFPFHLNHENVMKYKTSVRSPRSTANKDVGLVVSEDVLKDYHFYEVESVCNIKNDQNKNSWGGNARQLRENCIVSYFAHLIGSTNDCNFLSIVPYRVNLCSTAIGTFQNSDLSYENILRALNATLIALCDVTAGDLKTVDIESTSVTASSTSRKYIVNASASINSCYGFGIVRGMDLAKGILFVVTPVACDILEMKVNAVISAGAIELPIQFLTKGTSHEQQLPYVLGAGASKSKLDRAAKKQFNYKRTTPNVLKKCLQ